jgi:hypothetical protein
LLSNPFIKNDSKIEKHVIDITHVLWSQNEETLISTIIDDLNIVIAIADRYLASLSVDDVVNYGLMLVGIC